MAQQNGKNNNRGGSKSPRYSERYGANRPNPYTGYLPPGAAPAGQMYRPEAVNMQKVSQIMNEKADNQAMMAATSRAAEESAAARTAETVSAAANSAAAERRPQQAEQNRRPQPQQRQEYVPQRRKNRHSSGQQSQRPQHQISSEERERLQAIQSEAAAAMVAEVLTETIAGAAEKKEKPKAQETARQTESPEPNVIITPEGVMLQRAFISDGKGGSQMVWMPVSPYAPQKVHAEKKEYFDPADFESAESDENPFDEHYRKEEVEKVANSENKEKAVGGESTERNEVATAAIEDLTPSAEDEQQENWWLNGDDEPEEEVSEEVSENEDEGEEAWWLGENEPDDEENFSKDEPVADDGEDFSEDEPVADEAEDFSDDEPEAEDEEEIFDDEPEDEEEIIDDEPEAEDEEEIFDDEPEAEDEEDFPDDEPEVEDEEDFPDDEPEVEVEEEIFDDEPEAEDEEEILDDEPVAEDEEDFSDDEPVEDIFDDFDDESESSAYDSVDWETPADDYYDNGSEVYSDDAEDGFDDYDSEPNYGRGELRIAAAAGRKGPIQQTEQDDTLFIKRERDGGTAIFELPDGVKLPDYIDDDEFLQQWLNEDEDMAIKDKRRRRSLSTIIGALTMLFAMVGFVWVMQYAFGIVSNIGNTDAAKDQYEEFIAPVVMSEVPAFETWSAIPQEKLLQSAVFSVLTNMEEARYETDDTNKLVIPSNDIRSEVQKLYGAEAILSDEALVAVNGDDVYYSDSDDCFHVAATGINGPQPEIINISKKGAEVTLTVGYLDETGTASSEGGYYMTMEYVLKENEGENFISAIRSTETEE